MKASVTYMRGPQTPRDVIKETTTAEYETFAATCQGAVERIRIDPPPSDTTEVRIVIRDTVK